MSDAAHTRHTVVAAGSRVYVVDLADGGTAVPAGGIEAQRPSCLAASDGEGVVWCGTEDGGVFRSADGGLTWTGSGLENEKITAVASGSARGSPLWAGTEPSAMWRSADSGRNWSQGEGLLDLDSSADWSFPPRPETHHVRWIRMHPHDTERLWVAIEAGALISSSDGGLTWQDRVEGGPYDTHELASHPDAPDHLHPLRRYRPGLRRRLPERHPPVLRGCRGWSRDVGLLSRAMERYRDFADAQLGR